VGPAFGNNKYCYTSNKGVEAALINWKDSFHSYIYFNGGCYFLNAEKYPTVSVLSHYTEIEGMPPAIISCKVAKGKALLSGIHFEYAAEDLTRDDPFHDAIYPFLNRTEEKRNKIFREILVACGIQQKKRDK
jgi:biotin--protein ligase